MLRAMEWLIFGILTGITVIIISPILPTKNFVASYSVNSGSMEPFIETGSIVFVKNVDSSAINKGDVISFTSPSDPEKIIIHRVAEVTRDTNDMTFKTKGDNNNSVDSWTVGSTLLKGKHIFTVPYLGYFTNFLKTPKGFLVGMGIPAVFVLFLQVKKIKEGIEEEIEKRTEKRLNDQFKKNQVSSII